MLSDSNSGWLEPSAQSLHQVHHPQFLPDHAALEISPNKRYCCIIACPNSCFAQPSTSCMLRSFLLSVYFRPIVFPHLTDWRQPAASLNCTNLPACLLLCRRERRTTRFRQTTIRFESASRPTCFFIARLTTAAKSLVVLD